MTAVIGILNKNAVALAADSAVTVSGSNGRKIYNTANKIFTLSKYHPVSIVIYNSANFITTPWEIIVKIYRNELGDKSFPNLKDYSDDFFKFLEEREFFNTPETINHSIQSLIYHSFNELSEMAMEKAIEDYSDLITKSQKERESIYKENLLSIIEFQIQKIKSEEKLSDFKSLTKNKFDEIIGAELDEILETEFSDFNTKKIKAKFSSLIFHYLKSKVFRGQWTGLVFAGYGDDDIYPTTISTKISDIFDNKIRFYTEHVEKIDDGNNGSIMPFAQRDVIDTLITGISPDINEPLFSTFKSFLHGYNDHLINLLEKDQPKLAKEIQEIDINQICSQFVSEIENVKEIKHIQPTVNTVSILSKEDLAEMAESLIYLTYLKRRISSDEESVGGPVDVAIISKGDGFIWIKRKHYFEENHNPHFIKNYFRT
ncbi:hypothetical protein Murru_1481 [Allomuricauda ruestringensis DSM 13258]|uniref:Uncharacterized protein n=1 Tax=Allomuricauda ruestringensis (strain DSM 13258 / CIP 107369 / LMG 19739 / B1) TaxID=886377 RepID=G2PQ57_ALLRU|nr:hypothetical protein [Allomuricauda ruestringensis]AEM70522.1 hypothetical protein Murru_1481 [Allomuricauda ruestringensis DSM 13258]